MGDVPAEEEVHPAAPAAPSGPSSSARPRRRRVVDASALPPETEFPQEGMTSALPPRIESWRKRSATGAILTGFAFGLREVLEPERDEPSIMLETSGLPPKDLPVEADLESALPRHNVVNVRPWLLDDPLSDGEGKQAPTPVPERAPPGRRRLRRRRR